MPKRSKKKPARTSRKAAPPKPKRRSRRTASGAVEPKVVAAIALALEEHAQEAARASTHEPSAWALAGRIRRMQASVTRRA